MRTLAVAFLLPALLLGAGCKKKQPPPPDVPVPVPTVEKRLQVTQVNPNVIPPNKAASARVFGSAFLANASVTFTGGSTDARASEAEVVSENTIDLTIPPLPVGTYDVKVTNPSGESAVLHAALRVQETSTNTCAQSTVNFDFDSSAIRADSKSVLDANMGCYQKLTGPIRIEGHADERGTIDYNIALGQRRADGVKQYIVKGGVSGSRISTTSYGEERPIDRASNEGAWAKNRRAEITAQQ